MTQQEINNATKVINEASAQLRIAKDKLDAQERLLKTQEEMIEILKATIANRDKFIAILEGQLVIQDNAINKSMLKG
jgi:hypothetical protein